MFELFTLHNIVTYGGYIIAGSLVVLGMFGMGARQRRTDNDDVTQNLINNYKLTVDEQDKKIKILTENEITAGKEVAHLQGQIKVLSDIVALRDPQTAAVFKEAPEIFSLARENHAYSKANNEAINRLMATMENFINRLPALTPAMAA